MTTVFSNAPDGARRRFLQTAGAASALAAFSPLGFAQADTERQFAPQPGTWRTSIWATPALPTSLGRARTRTRGTVQKAFFKRTGKRNCHSTRV